MKDQTAEYVLNILYITLKIRCYWVQKRCLEKQIRYLYDKI
jgi:hypothetical protein